MKRLNKFITVSFVFLISIVIIWPVLSKNLIISNGESSYLINPTYINPLYIWQEKLNSGYFFGSQSLIFFCLFFWKILTLFSAVISPTVLFAFLGILLPSLVFYYSLKTFFREEKNNLIFLPSTVLYGINIYRIQIGYSTPENIILFTTLPLFWVIFYQLLNSKKYKYVFYLTILSISSSTMGNNLGIVVIPYLLMILYLVFFILTRKMAELIAIIKPLALLFVLILFGNLFWILPQMASLISSIPTISASAGDWNAIASGTFYDHFRFMGFWAFKGGWGGGEYFSYYKNYYQPVVIFLSYIPVIFSVIPTLIVANLNYLYKEVTSFFVLVLVIGVFLVGGTKGPMGFIYQFLYDNLTFFKIFREPYAKFTPLVIFSSTVLIYITVRYFYKKINNIYLKNVFSLGLTLIVLLLALPIFKGEVFKYKNDIERTTGNVYQIPDYWKDLSKYTENSEPLGRIFIFNNISYGNNYLWKFGANVAHEIADYILPQNVSLIEWIDTDYSDAGNMAKMTYQNVGNKELFQKLLGIQNSSLVLQENDIEWIFSKKLSPDYKTSLISASGLKQQKTFGLFTDDVLSQIPKNGMTPVQVGEFYNKLHDQPALILYSIEPKYFLPRIYSPKNIYFTTDTGSLDKVLTAKDYQIRSATVVEDQNTPASEKLIRDKVIPNTISDLQTIDYKRLNPTRYKVYLRNAKGNVPLVFNDNFDKKWLLLLSSYPKGIIAKSSNQIYGSSQNDQLSSNYLDELINDVPISDNKNHLKVNGYANAWVINVSEVCESNPEKCEANNDGTFNLMLTIDYSAQKSFYCYFLISLSVLIFSFCLLIFGLIRKK